MYQIVVRSGVFFCWFKHTCMVPSHILTLRHLNIAAMSFNTVNYNFHVHIKCQILFREKLFILN